MIFLTVGTQLPFDRLVRTIDDWAGTHPEAAGQLFGQIAEPGPDGYRPRHFEWVPFLAPAEHRARFETADLILSHAGMGSIITALDLGKPIVIFARRAHLSEQRNDHQAATVERFRQRPGVHAAADETELRSRLDHLTQAGGASAGGQALAPFADDSLIAAIRGVIQGEGR
ncbi:MAG: glycosyltransferase [Pseudomonadota bacterium]